MDYLYSDDPIVACSSGNNSNCAIAVIRLSGFESLKSFANHLSLDVNKIKPRVSYFSKLIFDGVVVDEVVVVFFEGPRSYNGENIIELSVHGNMLNVDRIVNSFVATGNFRHAHPGEFSYRALRNKKLNLSQVEGLDLLLNANSAYALSQGLSLMSGKLQESYLHLHKTFLNHLSSVEFSIDFLEDMGEERAQEEFDNTLALFQEQMNKLAVRVSQNGSLLSPEVIIVGQPNSGKSTFFNQMVGEDRSIVTKQAGTTRDYISETITISDVRYRLIDTAGIRLTTDMIEREGVRRSISLAQNAFFKILLINPFEFDLKYIQLVEGIQFDLIIFTHSDLKGFDEKVRRLRLTKDFSSLVFGSGPMGAVESGPMGAAESGPMGAAKSGPMGAAESGPMGAKEISCSLIDRSEALLDSVGRRITTKYLETIKHEPILLQRHKVKVLEAKDLLDQYSQLVKVEGDISIISSELNAIGHCISELIGIVSPDDVLHNIFDNFCIGK